MSRGRGQLIVCSKMALFTAALALEAAFDGGRLTSDGGLLWLSKMDSTLGFAQGHSGPRAGVAKEKRSSLASLIKQRVFQIACGYEASKSG